MELIDIFCAVFDLAILNLYLKGMLHHRKDAVPCWLYWICMIAGEAVLVMIPAWWGAVFNSYRTLITIGLSLTTVFLLTFFFDARMRHKLFTTVSFQVYATISEILIYIIFSLLPKSLSTLLLNCNLYGAVCSKILLFLFLNITILMWNRKETYYNFEYTAMILLMPILSLVLLMTIPINGTQNKMQEILSLVGMAGILLGNIANFYLLKNILNMQVLRQQQLQTSMQLSYQESKYQQIAAAYRNSRSLLHDMKKHLFFIENCIENHNYDPITTYIRDSIHEMEQIHNHVNTGNLVIDAFLSSYELVAQKENIEFHVTLQFAKSELEISDYDLSILLGNLLDNAMEACRGVKSAYDPYIEVEITTTGMDMILRISNSIMPTGESASGLVKKDPLQHGFGIENIKRIVNKYSGSYSQYIKEDTYHCDIIIPRNGKGEEVHVV